MRSALLLLLLGNVALCAAEPAPAKLSPRGLPAGVAFLRERQSDDGAWRSEVYATFKDGSALTPLALAALQADADATASSPAVMLSCSIQIVNLEDIKPRLKAAPWLARFARPAGTVNEGADGLPYPTYTAALAVLVLSDPENVRHVAARDAWLKYLLARQLTEANGWQPADKQYGGWGYYPFVPKKPRPGAIVPAQQLLESNLSATVYALEALRAARCTDTEVYRKAQAFVLSCRNADGGFHFVYDDPVRNKAGATRGPDGEPRFHSYGSATADGVRALLLCGLKPDAPEVRAGRDWLVKHFAADRHPGDYIPTHESSRDAVYFYYAASVAKALRKLGVTTINGRHWAEQLAAALMAKQRPDGSWANAVELVRENDPTLATAYAVIALAECKRAAQK
jgi:hypothetical protein